MLHELGHARRILTMLIRLLFVLLLVSPSAFAHKLHSHGPGHSHDHSEHSQKLFKIEMAEVEKIGEEKPLTQDEVNALIEHSHEIIEGDHSGNFFKRWVQKFDFKTRFMDGYRWASAKSKDPRFKDTVTDSLLLFGLSHLVEMASGPVMLAVGAAADWPNWLMVTVGGIGATISVPGLDPMCILIFSAYAKSSKFRSAVGTIRAVLMKPFVKEEKPGLALSQVYFSSPEFVGDEPPIKVAIASDGKGTFLQEVTIQKNLLSNLKMDEYQPWLQSLGWNARDLIKKLVKSMVLQKDLSPLLNKPYVEEQVNDNGVLFIKLLEHSISIRKDQHTCNDYLNEEAS